MKKLRVTIEGKVYEVLVEEIGSPEIASPAAHQPIASAGTEVPVSALTSAAPSESGPGDVLSPLSGRVSEVACVIGQSVEIDDRLATIEAMKMNTYIHAQTAGKVTAVHVKAGDPVEEGQAILTIQ